MQRCKSPVFQYFIKEILIKTLLIFYTIVFISFGGKPVRKEYVIFIILLGALLPSGCAENGSVEPEPSVSPVETPVEIPALHPKHL